MQKLYCYVDESGQDTEGLLFVVGVLIMEDERDAIARELERIELESKKRNKKWRGAPYQYRQAYIEKILQSSLLHKSLFYEIFYDSKKYIKLTSYATAKAILKRAEEKYQASIFVDGFNKKELERFEQGLRELRIHKRKLQGVRREENDIFIRLADALCGLVRDAQEDNPWAKNILKKLLEKDIVTAL
ncbi:MAG TPA: DUF3800 domain-containing protein [Candidatus Paceibacterota bacterium]